MYQLTCKIIIGATTLELVHSVEIKSSWKELTDTCVIELPRKVKGLSGETLDQLIRKGDKVQVLLGYDGRLSEEFVGYVQAVKPTFPVQVVCEDKMYLLKQQPVQPKAWESATVHDVLQYIGVSNHMPYKVIGDVVTLGAYQITPQQDTAAKVLKALKEECPVLMSFIRGGTLCVGDPYDTSYAKTVDFAFGKNIISHQLEYRRAEDVKYRIKMTSKNDNGTDTTLEVGDSDAELRTFTVLNKSTNEMKQLAELYLAQLKFDGFRGSLEAFGEPLMRHGYICNLQDAEEQEKAGKYYCDETVKTFGMGGFRQTIVLGKKAAV